MPTAFGQLTPRELDVVRLIAGGQANREIASTLVVSEATVKTYVNRIFAKLGLDSRGQVVDLAYEAGLVVPGAPSTNSASTNSASTNSASTNSPVEWSVSAVIGAG